MSYFDPVVKHSSVIEEVNYIVPERIREACKYRMYSYNEAADKCGIDSNEFGLMANGHKNIPDEYIFKLMKGLGFPRKFFYRIKWGRI